MSKVICEVCGTMYPETASQCPICGCVGASGGNTVAEMPAQGNVVRTPVKGGRFSKSNVRKRNRPGSSQKTSAAAAVQSKESNKSKDSKNSDKGLVILLVILLIAILCVTFYIATRFIDLGVKKPGGNEDTKPSASAASDPTEDTSAPTEKNAEIPCTDIKLNLTEIGFSKAGASQIIKAVTTPADTTDEIRFESTDPAVVKVDKNGRVTAVGKGEAKIAVTCGDVQVLVNVVCADSVSQTEPTEETTSPTEETTDEEFYLSPDDITLFYEGESYTFSTWVDEPDKIVWSSDDTDVVTVKNGTITAVDGGTAVITAKYKNKTATCIIRCSFQAETSNSGSGENESSGGNTGGDLPPAYIISHIDVTLSADESFVLSLSDTSGNVMDVSWSSNNESVCTVSGDVVTATGSGTANVSCTYEGVEYFCIVRVI